MSENEKQKSEQPQQPAQNLTNTAPPTPRPEDVRYTDDGDTPPWLVGKSAKEAAQIARQLYEQTLKQVNVSRPEQPAATPQPQQQPVNLDELWVDNPNAAFQQGTEQLWQQRLVPELQQLHANTASTNREIVRNRYPKDFDRYGPEIMGYVNGLTPQQQTVDALEQIVKIVRANHLDDIVRERTDARLQELQDTNTMRPGVSGAAPSQAPTDALDLEDERLQNVVLRRGDGREVSFATAAKAAGITQADIDTAASKLYPGVPLAEARKQYNALLARRGGFTEEKAGVTN